MRYEHVDFNSQWAASKKMDEFMKEMKDKDGNSIHGLTDDQLKEAHALCVKDQAEAGKKKR